MESIEDDLILPIPEAPLSPINKPKLKRLKKSSSVRVSDDLIDPVQDLNPSPVSEPEDLDKENLDPLDPIAPISDPKDAGGEDEFGDDLDPLFSVPAVAEGFETLDLEREREEEEGADKIRSGSEKEKTVRKRLSLDVESEGIPRKKRTKKTRDGEKLGEKVKESVREKKRSEKERVAQLKQIHADTQRLLRETREASFKPVPVVQKRVSLVLEKIRLRKLEVLKQTSIFCQSDSVSASDDLGDETVQKNSHTVRDQNDSRDSVLDLEEGAKNDSSPQIPCGEIPGNDASDCEVKNKSPTPANITQQCSESMQLKCGDDKHLDNTEESSNPPLHSTELNPVLDDLSLEDTKERIDPRKYSAVDSDSLPDHGLAKAFIDDEAEEEDDSDHDLMRILDNEEDDSDTDEVDHDFIETGCKEAPADDEKRKQLQQKMFEQKDAAETDDIIHRLNGHKQREPVYLDSEEEGNDDFDEKSEDEESQDLPITYDACQNSKRPKQMMAYNDDFDEDSEDEKSQDTPITDDARQNSKRAKQMMAQMFTDADDSYVPSDDEESERTLFRQRTFKQSGDSSFISPIEDEHSREVFNLIKKTNIVSITKRRGKSVASSFDSLVIGANSNSSSKSSFLNRTTTTSLPSVHKQKSTTMRAFIFGRDDSNSRSAISTSESILDVDLKEKGSSKPVASKICSTQFKSTAKTKSEANTGSASSSLFQILKQASVQFDRKFSKNGSNHQEITEAQTTDQFSAFKLGKRTRKVESRIS